jgi:homoserine kinase type II
MHCAAAAWTGRFRIIPGMAVYTEVREPEVAALLQHLNLPALVSLRGIASGIENSNYFVQTVEGEWVLTLFERLTAEQLPYYLRLMQHLARAGIPVPEPRGDATGRLLHNVASKPAALVTKLQGDHVLAPSAAHTSQVGAMLARMHVAAKTFGLQQPHLRGIEWWQVTVPEVLPHVAPAVAALLREELAFQQIVASSPLCASVPRGVVHADLFRDNVMFAGDGLSGFFDFFFAGTDHLLFDLAVCLNDWCIDDNTGALQEERALAMVQAYHAHRPLTSGEVRLMPALLRAAAFRFWLSRLWDWHLPRAASMLTPKDPTHFERVLRQRIAQPWHPVL